MGKSLLRIAATSAAFVTSLAGGADAGERTWYLSIEGGAAVGGNVSAAILDGPLCGLLGFGPGCQPDASVESGWAALGAVGMRVMSNLRIEGEAGYRSQELGSRNDVTQTTVMVNALFDIPLSEAFELSIGGGLGFDWIDTGAGDRGPLLGSDSAFAYQLIAGLSYDIADNVELTLNYRYTDADFEDLYAVVDGTPTGSAWGVVAYEREASGTVSLGLRFGL